MLGGISINRYDRSLRFMVTCLAGFRKQAAQTCCRQNLVPSRVWPQRKRRTFVGLVHPYPLACAVFINLLRVGKEVKESTAQRSLALFLVFCILQPVKKTCFQRKIVKALRFLPLILRGIFLIIIFLHSGNTILEKMAIFKKNICKFLKYL